MSPNIPSLTQREVLARLKRRGHSVATIIDIGASDGQWSARAGNIFPDAHFLLLEANEEHRPALAAYKGQYARIDYLIAAASDHAGETWFVAGAGLYGGTTSPEAAPGHQAVKATTIDQEVQQRRLPPPYLIKIDTHGCELEILRGAARTLEQTQIAVIEAYFFKISRRAPLFYELCFFMAERGFGCVDIMEPLWREFDQALWQMDLVFVPHRGPEFAHPYFS